MLLAPINNNLDELIALLNQLSDSEYTSPCPQLSKASIGEHCRHIIELFQCLLEQYDSGVVNYDKRQRNTIIQTSRDVAVAKIEGIKNELRKPNKAFLLQQMIDGNEISTESNYHRELLYNFEHCIHHQALIKVALLEFSAIQIDENFGVARSTIEYKKKCVQ